MKKVCMIASGGGHLMELIRLLPAVEEYDFYIVTEKNVASEEPVRLYKHYFLLQQERRKIDVIFKFLINFLLSLFYVVKERPDTIISTGAGVAYPTCLFAKLMGKKIIFLESFARSQGKSLTGKLMYPISDFFIVQWKEMLKYYPNAVYHGTVY